jgi:hypothetical protein
MLKRRAQCGGLSMRLIFSKQTASAVARQVQSVLAQVELDSDGDASLDDIFVDSVAHSGTERAWMTADDGRYATDVSRQLSAAALFFPKCPLAANAALLEMHRVWAQPVDASLEPPVKLNDWAVLCSMSALVGKDREEQAMAFIGRLYEQSPKQAALAFKEYTRITHDFYIEHAEMIKKLK